MLTRVRRGRCLRPRSSHGLDRIVISVLSPFVAAFGPFVSNGGAEGRTVSSAFVALFVGAVASSKIQHGEHKEPRRFTKAFRVVQPPHADLYRCLIKCWGGTADNRYLCEPSWFLVSSVLKICFLRMTQQTDFREIKVSPPVPSTTAAPRACQVDRHGRSFLVELHLFA